MPSDQRGRLKDPDPCLAPRRRERRTSRDTPTRAAPRSPGYAAPRPRPFSAGSFVPSSRVDHPRGVGRSVRGLPRRKFTSVAGAAAPCLGECQRPILIRRIVVRDRPRSCGSSSIDSQVSSARPSAGTPVTGGLRPAPHDPGELVAASWPSRRLDVVVAVTSPTVPLHAHACPRRDSTVLPTQMKRASERACLIPRAPPLPGAWNRVLRCPR